MVDSVKMPATASTNEKVKGPTAPFPAIGGRLGNSMPNSTPSDA